MNDGYLAGYIAGQEAELERIVNLLDSNDGWIAIDAHSASEKQTTVTNLIALFKRGNNG